MDTFVHIKVVIGIILSLSIAHILKGVIKLIEHPGRFKPYWVHLLWALYAFLLLIHFWWWEIKLGVIKEWIFAEYLFLIVYILLYYGLCVLLFPDDLREYSGFEAYFYSRKKWFFAILALIFAADFLDTYLKGKQYAAHLQWEYPIRNMLHIVLSLAAIKIASKRFHAALVIFFILLEIVWIFWFYNT